MYVKENVSTILVRSSGARSEEIFIPSRPAEDAVRLENCSKLYFPWADYTRGAHSLLAAADSVKINIYTPQLKFNRTDG